MDEACTRVESECDDLESQRDKYRREKELLEIEVERLRNELQTAQAVQQHTDKCDAVSTMMEVSDRDGNGGGYTLSSAVLELHNF